MGTPDVTPAGIRVAAQKAGLTNVSFPSCSVANEAVTSGATARCFAQYMQIHALEATGGFVYAQMGQYLAKPGTPKSELSPLLSSLIVFGLLVLPQFTIVGHHWRIWFL